MHEIPSEMLERCCLVAYQAWGNRPSTDVPPDFQPVVQKYERVARAVLRASGLLERVAELEGLLGKAPAMETALKAIVGWYDKQGVHNIIQVWASMGLNGEIHDTMTQALKGGPANG